MKRIYIVYLLIVLIVFSLVTVFIIKQSNSNIVTTNNTSIVSSEESNEKDEQLITENDIEQYAESYTSEDKYSSLTNSEKKAICNYIQRRYDYYDTINGGYAGDKYSDTIMQKAANEFGLTAEQAYIIWCNKYSY